MGDITHEDLKQKQQDHKIQRQTSHQKFNPSADNIVALKIYITCNTIENKLNFGEQQRILEAIFLFVLIYTLSTMTKQKFRK